MRLIIRRKGTGGDSAGTIPFTTVSAKQPVSRRGLLLSAGIHFLLLVAIPRAPLIYPFEREDSGLSAYTVQPISVLFRAPVYVPRKAEPAAAKPARVARQEAAGNPAARMPAKSHIPSELELPVVSFRTQSRETVMQSQTQPVAPLRHVQLYRLTTWARRTTNPSESKQLLAPGRAGEQQGRVESDASPKLEVPNQERLTAEINVAADAQAQKPALPVAASSTTPVRIRREMQNRGALDETAGDAANIMVLSPLSPDTPQLVQVPPGSGGPALEAGRGGQGAGSAGVAADHPESHAASGNTAIVAMERGEGHAGGHAEAPPARIAPVPDRTIRKTHPIDGAFDVVIVQSSPAEAFPRSGTTLTGKPIYTVYLQVGARKSWPLQFCVPKAAEEPRPHSVIVRLETQSVVKPPYPISTVVAEAALQPRSNYVIVHGYITPGGRFRNLTQVGDPETGAPDVLASLEEWEFRPSTKDQNPVEVEILLAIPPPAE